MAGTGKSGSGLRRLMMIVFGGMALIFGVVMIGGALAPAEHSATVEAEVALPPTKVWEVLADVEKFPEWRSGLQEVRDYDEENRSWVEVYENGDLPLRITEEVKEKRLVLTIDDEELPFRGTWTFVIEKTDKGCRVHLTEEGEITNLAVRFMARMLMDEKETVRVFLGDLERRCAEVADKP